MSLEPISVTESVSTRPSLLLRIRDSQDTLAFSALTGVRPTIETMPLERAAEAYHKMMRGEARFRMVLTTGL